MVFPSTDSGSQKTPLYEAHLKLGAKMVDFAGWILPLWYPGGQTAEHMATRQAGGLFDIYHMGEFKIEGSEAVPFLSRMLTNRVEKMADNQAMYHFMLNEKGGVIDDCILYRFAQDNYMLVVNAANTLVDLDWLTGHIRDQNVTVQDISEQTAKLDLQGPNTPKLMAKWIPKDQLSGLKFFRFIRSVQIEGMDVLVSRTGYTGEVGFEIYISAQDVEKLWNLLLSEGKEFGVVPCGLAARDTLRIEAGLPLHGHELKPDRAALGHPWEFVFNWEGDFIGKKALDKVRENGSLSFILPFAVKGKRKAMPDWEVIFKNKSVGKVLSSVISPSLGNTPIGFFESDRPFQKMEPLRFKHPGGDVFFEGEVAEIPFIPLNSRQKMEVFLS